LGEVAADKRKGGGKAIQKVFVMKGKNAIFKRGRVDARAK